MKHTTELQWEQYQNLWEGAKVIFSRIFIILITHINKQGRLNIILVKLPTQEV